MGRIRLLGHAATGLLCWVVLPIGMARGQETQEPKGTVRKDTVRYKGQDLSVVDFKNRCEYVDETNFTAAESEHAVFVEARIGPANGNVQTLMLRRHGKEIPLVCRFDRSQTPPRVQKQLKENKIVWAYGWFTDAATGENVVEAAPERRGFSGGEGFGGRGRRGGFPRSESPREEDRISERERSFHLVMVGPANVKDAVGKLKTSALAENSTVSIDAGQSVHVVVEVANQSSIPLVDVEVQVLLSFADTFQPNQIVDSVVVDFDRVPGRQTVSKTVALRNRVSASFIPRARSLVMHAVPSKE